MRKALLLYWHGLGDVIQLTPHLRYLYNNGYFVDLMCRKEVGNSGLLESCPYIDKLIEVENPWISCKGILEQKNENYLLFDSLKKNYDWTGSSSHAHIGARYKIDYTAKQLKISLLDKQPEVFIDEDVEEEALLYIEKNYPNGYIFVHTQVEWHNYHSWSAEKWIRKKLPNLPLFDTDYRKNRVPHSNINFSFVLAREATCRVLSSSVFVHACDAMKVSMDAINYGNKDRKVWPVNEDLANRIREKNRWLVKKWDKWW